MIFMKEYVETNNNIDDKLDKICQEDLKIHNTILWTNKISYEKHAYITFSLTSLPINVSLSTKKFDKKIPRIQG